MSIRTQKSSAMMWLYAVMVSVAVSIAPTVAAARSAPDSFADLAEKLQPAVVNISTTQTVRQERAPDMPQLPQLPQFPPGSPFEDLFKEFFGRQRSDAPPRRATSLGSGFIIDPAGLVVTNNHVIADADEITVILHDETALKAEVVGRDQATDLALLKVKAPNKLPYVSWGSSDEVRVGDWVLAIGNPFGLGGSVTAGIISARARDIHAGRYDDFLQTDAAINRGNSGGPMFNMKGEVIGVNTAIISPSGGSIGIGFAIPSTMANQVIADLQKYGKTRRGWLGVHIQSLNDEIADNLGLKEGRGALVASVAEDGPAWKAGIRPGDIITKFDGKDVGEMRRLPRIVAETPINKPVEVTIWRDGKMQTIRAVVGELKEEDEVAEASSSEKNKPDPRLTAQQQVTSLGLSIAPITPQMRERYNLSQAAKGVVVTDVKQNGPAAEKGLRVGDVVLEVGFEPVKTPADFAEKIDAAKKNGRKSILLLVEQAQGPSIIALRLQGEAGR